MPDYSLVPVDHQPDFADHSLVPVEHNPFATDGLAHQAQVQQAQAPSQQPPAAAADRPDAGAPAADGVLSPLIENGRVDSYVYKKISTGTPPIGPQVTTANGRQTITATNSANHTNFGGVYGHTLTVSESGSNNLGTITAADPNGLLVATPVEGNPNLISVREYKGY